MLELQNTPNLLGISIHGDYQDLKSLYNSLHRYAEFCFSSLPFPEEEKHEALMVLCYELRHAFLGDRDFEARPNNVENIAQLAQNIYKTDEFSIQHTRDMYKNGNLYFSVKLLYPQVIYYLFVLSELLNDYYSSDWFKNGKTSCTPLEAEYDRGLIQIFVSLLFQCLQKAISQKSFQYLRECQVYEPSSFHYTPEPYITWLCSYYLKATPDVSSRKIALSVMCFSLFGLETNNPFDFPNNNNVSCKDPISKARIHLVNVIKKLNQVSSISYMQPCDFYAAITACEKRHVLLTEDIFEKELIEKQFGILDWTSLNW